MIVISAILAVSLVATVALFLGREVRIHEAHIEERKALIEERKGLLNRIQRPDMIELPSVGLSEPSEPPEPDFEHYVGTVQP